jgi:hypothetical protein
MLGLTMNLTSEVAAKNVIPVMALPAWMQVLSFGLELQS